LVGDQYLVIHRIDRGDGGDDWPLLDCNEGRVAMKRPQLKSARQSKKSWPLAYMHLREWREYRGLSVEALADKAGVSAGLISIIENRKSPGSPVSLEKLARALQIDLADLLAVKPDPDRRGSVMRFWVPDADRARVKRLIAAILEDGDKP
jgi:transcriptional regulator with XRE-family HTH domain